MLSPFDELELIFLNANTVLLKIDNKISVSLQINFRMYNYTF